MRFKPRATATFLLVVFLSIQGGWGAQAFVSDDSGCYCHNLGVAIYVNGTDAVMPISVQKGQTFSLDVVTIRVAATGILPAVLDWQSNLTDNSKFGFTPTTVVDNSPNDLDNTTGNVEAIFRITAPSTNGSYAIYLAAQGNYVGFIISVGQGSGSSSNSTVLYSPFAAIAQLEAPSAEHQGDNVKVNVSVQNIGKTDGMMFFYAVDGSTGQTVLPSVYSASNVSSLNAVNLTGEFTMPNRTVEMVVRVGHVVNGTSVDDNSKVQTVSLIAQPVPPPAKSFPEWLLGASVLAVAGVALFLLRFMPRKSPR